MATNHKPTANEVIRLTGIGLDYALFGSESKATTAINQFIDYEEHEFKYYTDLALDGSDGLTSTEEYVVRKALMCGAAHKVFQRGVSQRIEGWQNYVELMRESIRIANDIRERFKNRSLGVDYLEIAEDW